MIFTYPDDEENDLLDTSRVLFQFSCNYFN